MAKLYFRYGVMGSSKTAGALMVKYNYEERGQKVLLLKPAVDTREAPDKIVSRSGLWAPCRLFDEIYRLDVRDFDCVIVDEAQFLTKQQVRYLCRVVDEYGVPVIAYGLRADFKGELFEGSQWLLAWADAIEEVKTICWCGKKATFNARYKDGKVLRDGEQVLIGANDQYTSLCRRHYYEGNLGPGQRTGRQSDK